MTTSKKNTFPLKLWQLLNDCRLKSALRWSDDGQSFFVFEGQLRNLCLGKENKVFFTRQPKSFIRQLHLYGFRKLNKTQFKHPKFCRDQPHLIHDIKRSYRQTITGRVQGSANSVIEQIDLSSNNNDNSNDTVSYPENSFDSYGDYNYNYGYYIPNINETSYVIDQQFTSSSISSLCVCPGCCTL